MYRRVMAIFLQYDICLILLVELPTRNLLCTRVIRAFIAFTEIAKLYIQQIQLLKLFNVLEINLLSEFQFNLKYFSKYCDMYCIVHTIS